MGIKRMPVWWTLCSLKHKASSLSAWGVAIGKRHNDFRPLGEHTFFFLFASRRSVCLVGTVQVLAQGTTLHCCTDSESPCPCTLHSCM